MVIHAVTRDPSLRSRVTEPEGTIPNIQIPAIYHESLTSTCHSEVMLFMTEESLVITEKSIGNTAKNTQISAA